MQVFHEDWWIRYKYYYKRRHDLQLDWIRDRNELFNRIAVVCAEAVEAIRRKEVEAEFRSQQQELCGLLFEKVCLTGELYVIMDLVISLAYIPLDLALNIYQVY